MMTSLDKAQLHKRDNTKPKLGYTTCPKHGCEGTLQIKLYVEHWDSAAKAPKMCLISDLNVGDYHKFLWP